MIMKIIHKKQEVTVIIPVCMHDKREYFEKATESIFRQTYDKWRLIIAIDGEAGGGCEDVIDNVKHDERVSIIRLGYMRNLARVLNEVIPTTNTPYIARMDADDISHTDRFAKQVEFLETHKDYDLVGTWGYEIDEEGNIIYQKKMPYKHDDICKFIMKRSPFIHPSVMFRKSFFQKTGYYDASAYKTEDYELWCRALKKNVKCANIPEYLFYHRVDDGFIKKRRGLRIAWNECKIKATYFNSGKAKPWEAIYVAGPLVMRNLPEGALSWLYKNLRGGKW